MRFWDSSALVPLVRAESATSKLVPILKQDPDLVVWYFSLLECLSAIYRTVSQDEAEALKIQLCSLSESWTEVADFTLVRNRATRILSLHQLRSADSFQLAAALIACEDRPEKMEFTLRPCH